MIQLMGFYGWRIIIPILVASGVLALFNIIGQVVAHYIFKQNTLIFGNQSLNSKRGKQ